MRFDGATEVKWAGPGQYTTEIDAVWGIGGSPNGGYLMAVLARAALAHTGAPAPLVVSAEFLRPTRSGSAQVEASTVKPGRTATHAAATLRQDGVATVTATVVLGAAIGPPTGPGEACRVAPEAQCAPFSFGAGPPNLLQRMEVRYEPGYGPHDDGPAVVRGRVRLLSGEEPDALVALLAADALAPATFRLGYRSWSPTVQMTVQLHRAPGPGALAVEVVAGELRDGWFDEAATVWDSAGVLVARGQQLARLPRADTV
jgi:hypothetical protein